MKKLLLILMMIITGAVLSLAFPRASLWPITWVGLVPLLILARDSRPGAAALAGLAFGLGFFGAHLYWACLFGYSLWILLALIQSLWIALFSTLVSIACRSRRQWFTLLAVPAIWTVIEWLRSLGSLSFPWGYLAYTQSHNLPAVQLVSLTGPWGLTFVIALFNTALASPKGKLFRSVAVAFMVAAVVHAGGWWSLNRAAPEREKIPVTVLQGAVDDNPKLSPKQIGDYTVQVYNQLTSEVADYQPYLVVWPEAAAPGDIVKNPEARNWIASIAQDSGAYMLVGGPLYLPATKSRPATKKNGAHLLSPDGVILDSYYKVHLAPFGEFVPGRKWLPFLNYYNVREVDLVRGKEHKLLATPFGKTGVMICFESAFPRIARKETKNGANFLCVITREVIFKKTAAAMQHHDLAVFRAVENRRFVVRSAESGVSSIIDPYGRIRDSLGMWQRGILYGEIEALDNLTIYTRFGDWFVYLCILLAAFGVGSGIAAGRKKKLSQVV